MIKKELEKIKNVYFGYHEYLFGLHMELGGDGWGVNGMVVYNPTYKDKSQRDLDGINMLGRVQKLLSDAKVDSIDKLKNKPVEVTFDGNLLKEFRILTEVL